MTVLAFSDQTMALDYTIPSGTKAAAAAIIAKAGFFHGIIITTDGTNSVTLDIYDNASAATGTKLIPTLVIPSSSSNRSLVIVFPNPIQVQNGIYVNSSVAGGGAYAYMAYYSF